MTDEIAQSARPDRRTTLRWFAAAVAAGPLAACDGTLGGSWPNMKLKPIEGPGIGPDQRYLDTAAPWPLTMTDAERRATASLIDIILPADGAHPAASQIGVDAFIDEWISAPYETQQAHRALIVPGLAWLDREADKRGGTTFAEATQETKIGIVEDIAFKDRVKPGLGKPAEFFSRMRALTLGAYYTTPEGWADIGYLGNSPINGPYPGPTPEALAHIETAISKLPPARV